MSLKSYNTIKPASVALLYACDHAMLHYCNSKILFRHIQELKHYSSCHILQLCKARELKWTDFYIILVHQDILAEAISFF